VGYDDVAVRGDTALVHFTVPAARLGFHGMDMRFRVEPRVPAFAVTTS